MSPEPSGTGLGRRSQLGPAGNLQLKSLSIKINVLLPREGSTAVASPPPYILVNMLFLLYLNSIYIIAPPILPPTKSRNSLELTYAG